MAVQSDLSDWLPSSWTHTTHHKFWENNLLQVYVIGCRWCSHCKWPRTITPDCSNFTGNNMRTYYQQVLILQTQLYSCGCLYYTTDKQLQGLFHFVIPNVETVIDNTYFTSIALNVSTPKLGTVQLTWPLPRASNFNNSGYKGPTLWSVYIPIRKLEEWCPLTKLLQLLKCLHTLSVSAVVLHMTILILFPFFCMHFTRYTFLHTQQIFFVLWQHNAYCLQLHCNKNGPKNIDQF